MDYRQARMNMVEGQLRTNGIIDARVIEAFSIVPREDFLSGSLRGSAYVDHDIPLPGGAFLLEPLILARMFQIARPALGDRMLIVGDNTGYAAAVGSKLGGQVDSLSVLPDGAGGQSYDVIILAGAVDHVPDRLLAALAPAGRLVTVIRPGHAASGALTLIEKNHADIYARRSLFDAGTPYLQGFEPVPGFVF